MSDSFGNPHQNERNFNRNQGDFSRGGFRGGRGANNRDAGGFRIRLSDNEMKAARSIQDAFKLRSTVAVLGFAVRTLAQIVEEGNVEELIAKYGSQTTSTRINREDVSNNDKNTGTKPNPFARPAKPEVVQDENFSDQKEEADSPDIKVDSISSEPTEQIQEQEESKGETIKNDQNPS